MNRFPGRKCEAFEEDCPASLKFKRQLTRLALNPAFQAVSSAILFLVILWASYTNLVSEVSNSLAGVDDNVLLKEGESSPLKSTLIFGVAVFFIVLVIVGKVVANLRNESLVGMILHGVRIISNREYDWQRIYLTKQKVRELHRSKEFKRMEAEKGRKLEEWNWQIKDGKPADISD